MTHRVDQRVEVLLDVEIATASRKPSPVRRQERARRRHRRRDARFRERRGETAERASAT